MANCQKCLRNKSPNGGYQPFKLCTIVFELKRRLSLWDIVNRGGAITCLLEVISSDTLKTKQAHVFVISQFSHVHMVKLVQLHMFVCTSVPWHCDNLVPAPTSLNKNYSTWFKEIFISDRWDILNSDFLITFVLFYFSNLVKGANNYILGPGAFFVFTRNECIFC